MNNRRRLIFTTTDCGRVVYFGEVRLEELPDGKYRLFSDAVGPVVRIAPFDSSSVRIVRGIGGELSASWEESGRLGRVNALYAL